MGLGSLCATVVLDRPRYIYSGNQEPVTGSVELIFTPNKKSPAGELFGPLRVTLTFWGRAKTKIVEARGNSGSASYRGRAPLFSKTKIIHNGPFRLLAGRTSEVYFSINFPSRVTLGKGIFGKDDSWEDKPGHDLPPTMSFAETGFGSNFESYVEYNICAEVEVQGIDVETPKPIYTQVIYHPTSQLRPHLRRNSVAVDRRHVVQNRMLMPEAERPVGFKARAKAALTPNAYPRYPFNVNIQCPQHLQIGKNPVITINVAPLPDDQLCTMNGQRPDVELLSYSIKIKAHTYIRCEKSLLREHTNQAAMLAYRYDSPVHFAPVTLEENNAWTVAAQGKIIDASICPSFRTYNIRRTYIVTTSITIRLAGEKIDTSATSGGIVIHPLDRNQGVWRPGMYDPAASMASQQGNRALFADDEDDELPGYEGPTSPAYEEVPTSPAYERRASAAYEMPPSPAYEGPVLLSHNLSTTISHDEPPSPAYEGLASPAYERRDSLIYGGADFRPFRSTATAVPHDEPPPPAHGSLASPAYERRSSLFYEEADMRPFRNTANATMAART